MRHALGAASGIAGESAERDLREPCVRRVHRHRVLFVRQLIEYEAEVLPLPPATALRAQRRLLIRERRAPGLYHACGVLATMRAVVENVSIARDHGTAVVGIDTVQVDAHIDRELFVQSPAEQPMLHA